MIRYVLRTVPCVPYYMNIINKYQTQQKITKGTEIAVNQEKISAAFFNFKISIKC